MTVMDLSSHSIASGSGIHRIGSVSHLIAPITTTIVFHVLIGSMRIPTNGAKSHKIGFTTILMVKGKKAMDHEKLTPPLLSNDLV